MVSKVNTINPVEAPAYSFLLDNPDLLHQVITVWRLLLRKNMVFKVSEDSPCRPVG
jgi:hypothetical protein